MLSLLPRFASSVLLASLFMVACTPATDPPEASGGSSTGGNGPGGSRNPGTSGTAGIAGAGVAGSSGAAGKPTTAGSQTRRITPTGGTIQTPRATLVVPAGAVLAPLDITLTEDAAPLPVGLSARSPLIRFEPAGATFKQPLRVTFQVDAGGEDGKIYWSRPDGKGYEPLPTTATGKEVSAYVAHFSEGFVALGDPSACAAGLALCGSTCASLDSDERHCGACGSRCDAGGRCQDGVCQNPSVVCDGDLTYCGSGAGCVDLGTARMSCGACDVFCGGTQTCQNGACQEGNPECGSFTYCEHVSGPVGGCTDLNTDITNCGGCGAICAGGGSCVLGLCTGDQSPVCEPGFAYCDFVGSSPGCTDLLVDVTNCGTCGTFCTGGSCQGGICLVE